MQPEVLFRLIRAFNQNMSYDQFVHWQLAGDEIAPDDLSYALGSRVPVFSAADLKTTVRRGGAVSKRLIDDWVNATGNPRVFSVFRWARLPLLP